MAESAVVGVLRALLTLDSAEFESGMKKANSAFKDMQRDWKKVGLQATQLGTQLTKSLTLPILGAGSAAAKAAIDFESSFTGIRKTVKGTEAQFAALAKGMRDLSKEIPINVNELNRIGQAAGQLGIKTENILGFTEVMAKLGVTTNISSDQAATSLARLANITGMSQGDFDRLGSTIVDLGNHFATTEAEVVDFGVRIAAAGKIAGLTEPQILAIGAAMSSVGVEAEAGGTAVQKVLNGMTEAVAKGGDALTVFAATAGMSASEFGRAFTEDAAGAFNAFVQGLGQSGDQAFGVLDRLGLGNERVIRAFLSLAGAGDLLTRTLDTATTAWGENSALTEEARIRFATTEAQLTVLWNRIKDVGITIGNALLPMIQSTIGLLDTFIPALEWAAQTFASMPTPIQAVVLGLGGVAALAGPMIFVFGQLALSASAVAGAFTAQGLATRGLTGAMTLATTAARALWVAILGPVGLAAGAVLAFAALGKVLADMTPDAKKDELRQYVDQMNRIGNEARGTAVHVEKATPAMDALKAALAPMASHAAAAADGVEQLGQAATFTAVPTKEAAEAAKKYREEVAALAKALSGAGAVDQANKLLDVLQQMPPISQLSADTLRRVNGVMDEAIDYYVRTGRDAPLAFYRVWDATMLAQGGIEGYIGALQQIPEHIEPPDFDLGAIDLRTMEAARSAGQVWLETMQQIGQRVPDMLVPPPGVWRQSFTHALGNITGGLGGVILDTLKGGGNVGTAAGGFIGGALGSSLQKPITAGLSKVLGSSIGGALGSVIPGLGTIAGSFIGSGISTLFGAIMGGPSEQELAGRDAAGNFRKGLDAGLNDAQRAEAKSTGNVAWAASVIAVRDAYIATGRTEQEALNISDRLWRAEKHGAEAVKAVMEEINGVFNEQSADAARLDAAIQKYGFSFEQLGPKFQAQKLHEAAVDLIEDWRVLAGSGIDIAVINERMSGTVSEYLQTALRVGAEIPAAMKPILQSMIDQGTLLNENGVAIHDFESAGITFAETMTDGFTRVVDKLQQLIDKLNGAGAALQNIPRSVDVGVNYHRGNYPDIPDDMAGYGGFGIPSFATEGRVTKPLLAMIGDAPEPEYVLRESTLARVASGGVATNGGSDTASIDRFISRMETTLTRDLPDRLERSLTDSITKLPRFRLG
jgi:TP901 family phage tail tape measure protein